MGLFGFLKRKGETIELPPEEPEFLKEVDLSASGAAQGVKEQVEPELALWLSNGTAATGLKELASALKKMKAGDYKEHVNPERNEIAEWVQEILNDPELAGKLRKAKGKLQAAKAIEKEIKALKAAKNPSRARHASRQSPTAQSCRSRTCDWAQSTKVDLGATAKQQLQEKKGKKAEPKLPEIPETGYELQSIPLLDIPAEKPRMEAAKGGIFSRMFGRKPKQEGQEQPLESMPLLPEISELPELMEEPKAAKAMKEMKELLPQLPEEEKELQTPIEMPRLEDFQENELLEPITGKTPETKKQRKGFLEFLFKKKETSTKEEQAEAATEIDAAIAAAGAPSTPEPAKPSPALEFEPEPHHIKWEETPATAELPDDELDEQTEPLIPAPAGRKRIKAKGRATQHEEYDDVELIRQDHELERTEKELTRQEEELNSKRLELTRKRYELIKQKGELESKKFEEFIRKHKNRNEKEEALVREELYSHESTAGMLDFGSGGSGNEPRGRLKGMPDFRLSSAYGKERLEELLEEAKQHIRENNMEDAQRALHEVQSVFDTVYMTNNEKKQIEYEILEVEADIKLASLR